MDTIKFGTDGWRAVMCDTFTFTNVKRVSQALANYLKAAGTSQQGVVIGHDARFLGHRFAGEAAKVMLGNGIPVLLCPDDVPTPTIAHAVIRQGTAGAIMFTASHNPPEYNGIKFIPDYGGPASWDITSAIEKYLREVEETQIEPAEKDLDEAGEMLREIDPRPDYIQAVSELVDLDLIRRSNLGIVYDAMHGAGKGYLSTILQDAGAHVVALHESRDVLFGGRTPEPIEKHLPELLERLASKGMALGLANDGDADRFGVVDDDGTYISPNQVITLLLQYLVEQRGMTGSVVRTVATTHLIDRLAQKYGISVHETPVGFKHICARMRREPVIIGGEESGGLGIGSHIPEKDGILACLLVAELRAAKGKPLRKILKDIMAEVGPAYSRRVDLEFPDDKKQQLISELQQEPPSKIGSEDVAKVITIDGAKFVLSDRSWVLIRPSGTEPLLRVYLEAGSPEELETLAAEASRLVESFR